ncbi:MAG: general secretion pathway protein G [Thermoproteota archaeon]|jgi:general secretion pathway protein G
MQTRNFNDFKQAMKSQAGMSLIEILIALTLLGFTATFIAGKVMDSLDEGSVQSAKIQIKNIEDRLKEFRRHCGTYPTSEQGLDALIEKPTGGRDCKRYPADGYIDGGRLPVDPWDGEYMFESDGRKYDIFTYGKDGIEGGEGADADISSKDI